MIREKCKRVHERIQCIEKKKQQQVNLSWNVLEHFGVNVVVWTN